MPSRLRNARGKIPRPVLGRLCRVYSLLGDLAARGTETISSREIGDSIGAGSHTVRKDFSYLSETGVSGSGFDTRRLMGAIAARLGLDRGSRACVVGLDQLGLALMGHPGFFNSGFTIVAGFDSNLNLVETIEARVPVFPAYDIPEVVRRERIEVAVITVPGADMRELADRLVEGGVKGIVNLSPRVLKARDASVHVINLDFIGELRMLAALLAQGGA
ncbi:MAG: redox-sensing transcriptional repressor Rex [Spirochaetes bacterium]|nr:MAG: redox-sensing transcriptional repressor Rex [Spirochaetota bacterium]